MKIIIENASFKVSNNEILKDVDMQINTGSITCLLGVNGSGKSTLFSLIAGSNVPSGGSIYLQGNDDTKINAVNKDAKNLIAILPQEISDPVQLKVKEITALSRFKSGSTITWRLSNQDSAMINSAIIKCGISDLEDRQFTTLSAGEKQRVWLAFCLAQEKPFLLLDESLSLLDVFTKHNYFKLLKQLVSEGKGILVVTHDIDLAKEYADKVVVLRNGKIIFNGKPKEFSSEIM
tara:strand:+ start:768 stop:1469 length:702 start_codon:yes stop_codon:yes gene_type:complete